MCLSGVITLTVYNKAQISLKRAPFCNGSVYFTGDILAATDQLEL